MSATVTDDIRREIRAQLARKEMTQGELAQRLGIHEVQLSRMMTGKSEGTVSRWKEILEALGLELTVRER